MNSGIFNVEFKGSFMAFDKMPVHEQPEFCFIGRSNVGKSTLLNYLTGINNLAKTSKKPGKTQAINLFSHSEGYYFVDLPGYGYAIVSQKDRARWKKMIYSYLESRRNLALCFVLIDSRIEFQQIDRDFIRWCGENQIPIALVFTKTDAVKKNNKDENISKIKEELAIDWEFLPECFEVSSEKKQGGELINGYIANIINSLNNNK